MNFARFDLQSVRSHTWKQMGAGTLSDSSLCAVRTSGVPAGTRSAILAFRFHFTRVRGEESGTLSGRRSLPAKRCSIFGSNSAGAGFGQSEEKGRVENSSPSRSELSSASGEAMGGYIPASTNNRGGKLSAVATGVCSESSRPSQNLRATVQDARWPREKGAQRTHVCAPILFLVSNYTR